MKITKVPTFRCWLKGYEEDHSTKPSYDKLEQMYNEFLQKNYPEFIKGREDETSKRRKSNNQR